MYLKTYRKIRNGGIGFYRQKRGLMEVSGSEAIQFLDGLITNDMKTLEDGNSMFAAFPNAKGRMLAVVGVLRKDDKFLIETEETTYQKVYENLFRFTYAGDFHVQDLTEKYTCHIYFGETENISTHGINKDVDLRINDKYFFQVPEGVVTSNCEEKFEQTNELPVYWIPNEETYEVFRIESGIPKYGIDMDESTVVPEVGLANAISYNKGCYIGQEVIARIHFRGKVAKELKGLIFEDENPSVNPNDEIKSTDDKNAGTITSITYSPKLEKTIALGYVRNAFLEEETELKVGENTAKVKDLPFIK